MNECYDTLLGCRDRIHFRVDFHADIETNEQLSEMILELPIAKRMMLTSAEEVKSVIAAAPNKRSCGVDQMPYTLLKRLIPNVLLLLTRLFNQLLARSYFPRCWRYSIVTPIPKGGKDNSVIANWRPISSLNCISKVFERLMARRITDFIDGNCDVFQQQYGFLRGHSSVHALGRLHSDICDGLNNKKYTALVSLDLQSAFDTVWHEAIIYKMSRMGFPTLIVKMMQSFLCRRTFAVKVRESMTDSSLMPAGTPQGSVLSPILFDIFLVDIPTDDFVRTIQFADDTSAYATSDNAGMIQCNMNRHLARLHDFLTLGG